VFSELPSIRHPGEVYFVPLDARGHFPMKYEDGTLGELGFST
jgi:hypothetical protein